jgi:hypothetical protein
MIVIAQTTMIAAALALLVYIAVIATGIYTTQNVPSPADNKSSLAEQTKLDSAMRQRLATSLDYVHRADLNQASLTVPLHGVNLGKNQFILLYDSTSYATKEI